jgi:hypothetical protein
VRGLLLLGLIAAAPAQATDLRFITCPIYRDADAGRKSGCWLADDPDGGQRYDVSQAPSKPDWNFQVLVEGRVASNGGNPCGGIVLDPVRTSILPERCPRHMLPAEGFPGRRFVLPERNVAPLSVARTVPPPPYPDRSFHLVYDFDRSFILYQLSDYLLDQAISWIRAASPRRIVVTGYAATEPVVVSGHRLAERAAVARERAEQVTEALVRLGVDRARIETRWRSRSQPAAIAGADGLAEPSRRRVEIDVLDSEAQSR